MSGPCGGEQPGDPRDIRVRRAMNKVVKEMLLELRLEVGGAYPIKQFMIVSRVLRASRTLKAAEKLVLEAILDHVWDSGEGGAFPGLRRLALVTGLSRNCVIEAAKKLAGKRRVLRKEEGPNGCTEYFIRPLREWRVDSVRKARKQAMAKSPPSEGDPAPDRSSPAPRKGECKNRTTPVQDPVSPVQNPAQPRTESDPKGEVNRTEPEDGDRTDRDPTKETAARESCPARDDVVSPVGSASRNPVALAAALAQTFRSRFADRFPNLPVPAAEEALMIRMRANVRRLVDGGQAVEPLLQGVENLFAWWGPGLRQSLAWRDEAPNLSILANPRYCDRVYALGLRTEPAPADGRGDGEARPAKDRTEVMDVDATTDPALSPNEWRAEDAAAHFRRRFREEFPNVLPPAASVGVLRAIQSKLDYLARERVPLSRMKALIDYLFAGWEADFIREKLKVDAECPTLWLLGSDYFGALLEQLRAAEACGYPGEDAS